MNAVKKFESGVDRIYEKIDEYYHKYHIVVDVVFFASLILFVSTALLLDSVSEVKAVLNYKMFRQLIQILDNYILPILAGLALVFDFKDKKLRLVAFFSLFILLLYQAHCENQIISIMPHTNTHYFGAACLVVAAAGQKWNRIGWIYVITCSACMVVLTFLSLIGVIPDLVFSANIPGRHALGMHYPLNWAAHWFSIALVYCMLRKGRLHVLEYAPLVVLFLVSLLVCKARTSSGLYFLLITGTAIYRFFLMKTTRRRLNEAKNSKIDGSNEIKSSMEHDIDKPVFENTEKKTSVKNVEDKNIGGEETKKAGFEKYILPAFVFSFWIMAIFMIVMTICYVPPISTALEHIPGIGTLTDRLAMGRVGLTNPDWFPSKFGVLYPTSTWNGTEPSDHYFFIDCSYVMILIRAGVVVFVIMMADLLWMPYRLLHAKEKYALVILSLFAIICAMEHHILDLSFNPFLLLSFSMIGTSTPSGTVNNLLKSFQHFVPKKKE